MFPPDASEKQASDRPDPPEERWFIWEEFPVVGRERARSLGCLYGPWYWDGAESDGVREES